MLALSLMVARRLLALVFNSIGQQYCAFELAEGSVANWLLSLSLRHHISLANAGGLTPPRS